MRVNRWTIGRRFVQCAVIGLLLAPLWSRSVFEGTLSAASLFGLQLSDPLATLQVLLLTGSLTVTLLAGTAIVLVFYGLLGGRVFCGWVCPVHLLTDLADLFPWTRRLPRWSLTGKVLALAVTALLSLAFGVPAFETLSPIGIAARALTFGAGSALLVLALILLAEGVLVRRLWCRSICPLGGFYALLGRLGLLAVVYRPERCTQCGLCRQVCFVPEVLEPVLAGSALRVHAGDCTRCGACIGACPERALTLGLRKPFSIRRLS